MYASHDIDIVLLVMICLKLLKENEGKAEVEMFLPFIVWNICGYRFVMAETQFGLILICFVPLLSSVFV